MGRIGRCIVIVFVFFFVFPSGLYSLTKPCQIEGQLHKLVTTDRIEVEVTEGYDCLSDILEGPRKSVQIRIPGDSPELKTGMDIKANISPHEDESYFVASAIKIEDEKSDTPPRCKKIDDWNPMPGKRAEAKKSIPRVARPQAMAAQPSRMKTKTESLGMATGGAKDINNFRRNIREGYVPMPSGIRHEGLFYDYHFDIGAGQTCDKLFCPTFDAASSPDPFDSTSDHYLAVGLKSGLTELERPPINMVVALDISGSMGSKFDQYYYDRFGKKHEAKGGQARKIAVAREVLSKLTKQLRPEDRLGLVVYNNDGYAVKPLRRIKCTDMNALRGHITKDITSSGGTNMSAGIEKANELFESLDEDERAYPRTNRLVFLADAMPNMGQTGEGSLQGLIRKNAGDRIYTTFTGIGLDANAELIKKLTQIEGANAYFVHSEKQFKERLNDEFKYMVTPLAFDVRLTVESEGFAVKRTYGTGEDQKTEGTFIEIPTFFPSPTTKKGGKGSILLAELEHKQSKRRNLEIRATYRKRNGKGEVVERSYQFPKTKKAFYTAPSIRKGIALSRWGDVLREWSESAYRSEYGVADKQKSDMGIIEPLSNWERRSVKLNVSSEWRDKFDVFREYLKKEQAALSNVDFNTEFELMELLLSK